MSWAEGSVVEPADNRFIADAPLGPRTEHRIGGADAAEAGRVFQASLAQPDRKTAHRLDVLIQVNRRQHRQASGRTYAPLPVVRDSLCQAARAAIQHHNAPQQLQQRAAALARDVAGMPAGQEAVAAAAIIEMAANLDKPLERPLAAPPAQGRDEGAM